MTDVIAALILSKNTFHTLNFSLSLSFPISQSSKIIMMDINRKHHNSKGRIVMDRECKVSNLTPWCGSVVLVEEIFVPVTAQLALDAILSLLT